LTRVLPLAIGGTDALANAMRKAHAVAESAKTGEPVANQLQVPPSCSTDAARIAARVPTISFGYTRLDAGHQDGRLDIALAEDISKAFSGLKVELPGLGQAGTAPFDVSLALSDLNEGFAKLGPATQKAAIPPFGDLLGVRLALDTLTDNPTSSLPTFSGRLVLATSNPTGLLAMGQMMVPALAQLKLTNDGKPVALPQQMAGMLGQPGWVAMSDKALALGV